MIIMLKPLIQKVMSKRSPIQHTYIGTGTGSSSGSGDSVSWEPHTPQAGDTVTITYDANAGTLSSDADPVYIHIGNSGWQDVISPDPAMIYDTTESVWTYEYSIPSYATTVDLVFNDGSGNWDNNYGSDWHISVTDSDPDDDFVIDGILDDSAQLIASGSGVNLYAAWNNESLYVACDPASDDDRFIFISDGNTVLVNVPWAKTGSVSQWLAYIANESTNNWYGWFDGGQ